MDNENKFTCAKCDKSFITKYALARHYKKRHYQLLPYPTKKIKGTLVGFVLDINRKIMSHKLEYIQNN